MVSSRACKQRKEDGSACLAPPLLDSDFCFWHDPEHQQAVADARKAGGARRRREGTLATAYEVGALDNLDDLVRLLQIAALDTLSLENSVARNRALAYYAQVGASLIEKSDLAARMASLEAALGPRLVAQQAQRKKTWWHR